MKSNVDFLRVLGGEIKKTIYGKDIIQEIKQGNLGEQKWCMSHYDVTFWCLVYLSGD